MKNSQKQLSFLRVAAVLAPFRLGCFTRLLPMASRRIWFSVLVLARRLLRGNAHRRRHQTIGSDLAWIAPAGRVSSDLADLVRLCAAEGLSCHVGRSTPDH